MRAGRLDQRISILVKTDTPDEFGEPIETWVQSATVWAELSAQRGAEHIAAQQVKPGDYITLTLRYMAEVTTLARVVWDGNIYDIVSVSPQGRRRRTTLELLCRKV